MELDTNVIPRIFPRFYNGSYSELRNSTTTLTPSLDNEYAGP